MVNVGFFDNLTFLSSIIAGFCVSIVIEIYVWHSKDENNSPILKGETSLIFTFICAAILLITACISSALLEESGKNVIEFSKINPVTIGTIALFFLGFFFFYLSIFIFAKMRKPSLGIAIAGLILFSIFWIFIVIYVNFF